MSKLRAIFHPIMVFIGVQIAWIALMGVWINWYLKNRQDFKALAQRLQPALFASDLNWVVLLEGCFLMILILGGVYLMFVFWNKQARLNRLQSNFVSSVSHELKSPLASLQLYLETLKYHDVSKEEMKDFVETMLNDTDRLSSLIDNILQASNPDSRRMQNELHLVGVTEFMDEVLEGHRHLMKSRNLEVKYEVDPLPVLKMDKRALRMAINNLINNAHRYSPAATPIVIRVTGKEGWCRIEFVDQGVGLSEKECKQVFRKFYRAQNSETQNIAGAGLGLYISREIIKGHGGELSVASPGKGKGCTFTVSLPIHGFRRRSLWEKLRGLFGELNDGKKEEAHSAG